MEPTTTETANPLYCLQVGKRVSPSEMESHLELALLENPDNHIAVDVSSVKPARLQGYLESAQKVLDETRWKGFHAGNKVVVVLPEMSADDPRGSVVKGSFAAALGPYAKKGRVLACEHDAYVLLRAGDLSIEDIQDLYGDWTG